MKQIAKFEDLKFIPKPFHILERQANLKFKNGWGISVSTDTKFIFYLIIFKGKKVYKEMPILGRTQLNIWMEKIQNYEKIKGL